MYKRQKASFVPLCHSQVYIFRERWETHVQQVEWIPFPAKPGDPMTSRKHTTGAMENPWK